MRYSEHEYFYYSFENFSLQVINGKYLYYGVIYEGFFLNTLLTSRLLLFSSLLFDIVLLKTCFCLKAAETYK